MLRRNFWRLMVAVFTLIPATVFAQGLSTVSTLNDPVAYSTYLRQRRTNELQVQRLNRQVAKATGTGQKKKIGEAAPRAGFQNQLDYFQNFR